MGKREEYQYENFKYILTEDNKLELETTPQFKFPKEFFKYYSLTNYNIEAVENSYFYATHPKNFNDSLDCSELILNFDTISLEFYKSIFNNTLTNEKFKELDINKLYTNDKKNDFSYLKEYVTTQFTRKIGIISLTTQPLNVLMWSHYTNEQGIAIGVDTKKFLNSLEQQNPDLINYVFRPVQYVDKIERINVISSSFSTPLIPYFYMTNIKRRFWDYENEWRMTVFKEDMDIPLDFLYPGSKKYSGKNSRFLNYDKNAIKHLFLGKYFFNGNNCKKINKNGSFDLQNNNENLNFIKFINWLYENHNDKLYISGEKIYKNNEIIRIVGKIELERLSNNVFKVIDLNEQYYL